MRCKLARAARYPSIGRTGDDPPVLSSQPPQLILSALACAASRPQSTHARSRARLHEVPECAHANESVIDKGSPFADWRLMPAETEMVTLPRYVISAFLGRHN
jgi:hypothetical protein